MNILIVDDSKAIRFKLRNNLESLGHTVVGEASTGKEAVSLYAELHPDLVTMDIVMPEMDGVTALSEIIKMDSHAKVVMMTSAATASNMYDTKKKGACHFLIKPFEKQKIAEVLEEVERQIKA